MADKKRAGDVEKHRRSVHNQAWQNRRESGGTLIDLKAILKSHKDWLESEGRSGELADLRNADLWCANLKGADLQGADLWCANLKGADLKGVDLQGADLQDANLQGADLTDANLKGVDLRGAKILPGWNLTKEAEK